MVFAYRPGLSRKPTCSAPRATFGAFVIAVLAAIALALPMTALARTSAPKCTISGTPGPDVLHGTPGRDVICGGGGADRLYGGSGDDVILGGPGSDHLSGGPGRDIEKGGTGTDICVGSAAQGDQITCQITHLSGSKTAAPAPAVPGPTAPDWSTLPEPEHRTGTPEECEHATSFCLVVPQLPPTVFEARLSTETVDTSLGDTEATLHLVIGDEEEVRSGAAVLEGPDGTLQTLPIPSTGGLGSYSPGNYREFDVELPFVVPASSPPGRYQLIGVHLKDSSGREVTLDREEVDGLLEHRCACRPAHPWLQVYQGPDITPPVLTGISQDQEEILPDGTVYIHWSVEASDYQSGVDQVDWTIGEDSGIWSGGGNYLRTGSVTEAVIGMATQFEMFWWSTGSWPILKVSVTDNAGNTATYTQANLRAMGLPTELTESG